MVYKLNTGDDGVDSSSKDIIQANNLEDKRTSKLQWGGLKLGGNKKIQRPMAAMLERTNAAMSTKEEI